MKYVVPPVLSLIISYLLSGCGTSTPVAATPAAEAATAANSESANVEDQARFIAAIQSAGGMAEVVDTISQPFFTPEGVFVTINGEEDVQLFEYENTQTMESEAAQVAPDGASVGTSAMMWVDTPHFYRAGRIIVLYIGSNTEILNLLENVLGPQFAGQ